MNERTLWREGDRGYFTLSVDSFTLSPIYLTAAAARRLLRAGEDVNLPPGYDLETLSTITWLTGAYGATVRVSERQAGEVAQLAQGLTTRHGDVLEPQEREGVQQVVKIVLGSTQY